MNTYHYWFVFMLVVIGIWIVFLLFSPSTKALIHSSLAVVIIMVTSLIIFTLNNAS